MSGMQKTMILLLYNYGQKLNTRWWTKVGRKGHWRRGNVLCAPTLTAFFGAIGRQGQKCEMPSLLVSREGRLPEV